MMIGIVTLVSCTGDVGPQGPAGQDGINGTDGTDGVDGNAVCLECHNLANKAEKEADFEETPHAMGTSYKRGTSKSCAKCHSHEGFVEVMFTGADTTKVGVAYPSPYTCGTCHDFHSTFDFENDGEDYSMRSSAPVSLMYDGHTTVLDLGYPSNLCANCHQPRTAAPVADADDSFSITSSHYGPHHGPQSTFLYGINGAEMTGSKTYAAPGGTTHYKDAGCVSCHMYEGNHKFEPEVDACKACHSDATSFDIDGVQTTVEGLLDDLAVKLKAAGVLDVDGNLVTGKYAFKVAQAFWNYSSVLNEDKSMGVHNPDYIIALLTNSIESI